MGYLLQLGYDGLESFNVELGSLQELPNSLKTEYEVKQKMPLVAEAERNKPRLEQTLSSGETCFLCCRVFTPSPAALKSAET